MLKKLSLITVLITLIGFLPTLVFNHGYLLIESDSLNLYVPYAYEMKRMLSSGKPLWTWNSYFGDSWLMAYPPTNPFGWFTCLFPYRWLLQGVMITQFLKYLCLSLLSYAYFRKVKFSKALSAIGALMYTFSSWGITNIIYWTFLIPMMVFPVFLIAIEHFLQGGRHRNTCLMGATFLVTFTSWYFVPCTIIPGGIYALCRLFGSNANNKGSILLKGSADIFVGFCMAAVIIFPVLVYMSGGARVREGNWGDIATNVYGSLTRIMWAVFPKVSESTKGSRATFIPVLGTLFVLIYIIRHRDWLSVLLIVIFVLYLTPLNGLFSLFTNPGYSRWAYAATFIFTIASLKVVEDGKYYIADFKKYSGIVCAAIALVVIALLFYSILKDSYVTLIGQLERNAVIVVLFMLNTIFLYSFIKSRNISVLLIGIVACAGLQFAACTMDLEVQLSYDGKQWDRGWLKRHKWISEWHRKYYLENDYPVNRKPFSYRTDFRTNMKTFDTQINIAQLKNWPSVETYCSVYGKVFLPLMIASDRSSSFERTGFSPGTYTHASFDALMSVRTVVDYRDPSMDKLQMEGVQLKRHTWNYDVYHNNYYIPMGFTYDSYVSAEDMDKYNNDFSAPHDVPRQMLANVSVNSADVKVFSKYLKKGKIVDDPTLEGQYKALPLDSLAKERRKQTCDWFAGDTHGFSAHVNMKKANMLFFSVPADPGFTATVDGKETKIYNVNLGLSAIEVGKGSHDIRFEFFPVGLKTGAAISLACLMVLAVVFLKERKSETLIA